MGSSFVTGLIWLLLAGAACLLSAGRLKKSALSLLQHAFQSGPALYAMLTLPGFFLHEGAHALAALILRVPVRGITFIPRREAGDMGVGAATWVAHRDALRLALIALAPLLAGTVVLGLLSGVLRTAGDDPRPWVRLADWLAGLDWSSGNLWVAGYLMWTVAGSMAPSETDMHYVGRGALAVLAVFVGIGLALFLLKMELLLALGNALGRLGDGLAVGAALNVLLLLPVRLLTHLMERR